MPLRPPFCPRLLVCDLDGTLLNSKATMSEATVAALRQAESAGVEVVFATGRRHSYAWQVLAVAGLKPNTVLISSNGAVTRTFAGESMRRVGMPAATALLICSLFDQFRSSLIFTFERTGPGSLVVEDIDALRRRIPRWVASNAHEIASAVPLESAFESGEDLVQAMMCGTLQEMENALSALETATPEAECLRQHLSVHHTRYAARDLSIVDLMPAACSKGRAIRELAALRGIHAAEIAAIGDNMNDIDMLTLAGHAVVMQNAASELLAMAEQKGWTMTASNEEDGAAQAILRMLNGRSSPSSGILALKTMG